MSDASPLSSSLRLIVAVPEAFDEACFSVPAIRALVGFCAEVSVFCAEVQAPLWAQVGGLKEVVTFPTGNSARKMARVLSPKVADYEAAISFSANGAAALARVGVAVRIGYPAEGVAKHLTLPVEVPQKPGPVEHRVRYYLLLVAELGLDPFRKENFAPPMRSAASESKPSKLVLALAPGSDFGGSHEWPVAYFAEVAQAVITHVQGEVVIVPMSEKDRAAQELHRLLDGAATLAPDDSLTELEGLLGLLGQCTAVIASDSSVPHLAAHVGTTCLTIFGPNSVAYKRPLGPKHVSIEAHAECSPCFLPKCALGADDHRCLKQVEPKQVLEALAKL